MDAVTTGVHHVGLAVPDVRETAAFFTSLLGWEQVREDPDYPAVFVSDGVTLLTLWQLRHPAAAAAFDRRRNAGLHHLALRVVNRAALLAVYQRLQQADTVSMEFAPEKLRNGPAMHMMCSIPGGIRVEFICV